VKWKEARAALAKRAPGQGPKTITTGKSQAKKATQVEPSEQQMQLGEGWSHVVRGGRGVNASKPPPTPNPIRLVTEARKPIATPTSKTARPKKPALKTPAAPKAASAHPSSTKLVVNPHPTSSPLEDISDLLDQLPIDVCVELIRRLLTSISSLPSGAARPRAVLKTVIFFVLLYVVLLKYLLEMLWVYNVLVQRKEFQNRIYSQDDQIHVNWIYVSHTDFL
jgi:hypothetical protein